MATVGVTTGTIAQEIQSDRCVCVGAFACIIAEEAARVDASAPVVGEVTVNAHAARVWFALQILFNLLCAFICIPSRVDCRTAPNNNVDFY